MNSNTDSTDTTAADDREAHSRHSVLRERIVEHLFIGEVLRILWTRDIFDAEILRSEFDAGGYDLVMCRGLIVRHVQLKVSLTDSSTSKITASLRLLDRPSGCILWLLVTKSLELDSFLWFGSEPGERLLDITDMETARHVKGDAQGTKLERNNHRRIPRSEFVKLGTIGEVLDRLFGTLP